MSHPPKPINTQRSLRAYQLLGFAVVIALLVGIGGWGALASINGAVIAPATVAVESYTKKVQHREGGIVSEIRVKEGDNVQKGDVLLVLSDAETRAELAIIGGQLDEVMGRRARLEAERDGAAAPSFMPELLSRADDPTIAKILAGQRKLFESETASLKGQQEQLEERMTQLEEQIRGLTAQLDSNDKQTKLINEELKAFKGLVEKGLIELTRVRERQGAAASLEGQRGEIVANIAQAKGKISEIRLQIIQLQDDSRVKILADLGDAETKMTELLERQDGGAIEIGAHDDPVSGHGLCLPCVGSHDRRGRRRGGNHSGDRASIRRSRACCARTPPGYRQNSYRPNSPGALPRVQSSVYAGNHGAKVTYIAADVTQPTQAGRDNFQPFYEIRLTIDAKERAKLEGKELKPGMPAEVFLQTGSRMAFSYFLKPLTDQFAHTFKEE